MPEQSFLDIWTLLRMEVEARNGELHSKFDSALADLSTILGDCVARAKQEELPPVSAADIASFRGFVEGPGRRLLFDPIRSFRRSRPQERVLAAIESHETGLDDLVRRLPRIIKVSGPELLEVIGPHSGSRLREYLLRRRDRIALPLRSIVELQFLRESGARAKMDGGFLVLLAQSSLLLLTPWQVYRDLKLRNLAGQETDERAWDRMRSHWLSRVAELRERGELRLPAFGIWTGGASRRLAGAIVARRRSDTRGPDPKLSLRRQKHFGYWSRQQRAVTALLDLEWELTEVLGEIASIADSALHSIDAEQDALIRELDAAIAWLQASQAGNFEGGFPPPSARLVSAADRLRAWERSVESLARTHFALQIETIEPRFELPRRREPWKRLEPGKHFLYAMNRPGEQVVLEGFREAESAHSSIVRVIERAREVVQFSLETAEAEPDEAATLAQEGLANALALLSYQRQSTDDPHAIVESRLVHGIAGSLLVAHLSIEQRRLGLLTQLARQSGSRLAHEAGRVVLEGIATSGRVIRDYFRRSSRWLLLKAGWEAPSVPIQAPTVARGYLGEVLSLQLGARDLPMIYRRLFRLAPVEEPRFLVGRETEMAALAHARDLWHSNRSVAAILVGNRGSGKTSLLNCAVAREFSDIEVIRSQFSERITDSGVMRQFLHDLLRIPVDRDFMEGLLSRKRIIILEELERTFLRRVNGFEGIRELLSILSASSQTTLWILCLNRQSFRYLDAAIGLGESFSHRINAMAIPTEQLKKAILLRHNLSGLRLQYPAVPGTGSRVRAIQQLVGLEPKAEDSFFDELYRQSEGIFRSAFELWQHFMERVEGGVLYMRQPSQPDFEPLIAQFTQQDSFTLQAILQHGSLTDQEHSEIFECSLQRSRVLLEKLVNLEFLELDSAGPGLRIRPEAGRVVNMALHRVNLI